MKKVSKKKANYRLAGRNSVARWREDCGNCEHMLDNGDCTVVEGKVDRNHTSKYWTARTKR